MFEQRDHFVMYQIERVRRPARAARDVAGEDEKFYARTIHGMPAHDNPALRIQSQRIGGDGMLQSLKNTLSRRELFRWSALLTAPALFQPTAAAAKPHPDEAAQPRSRTVP